MKINGGIIEGQEVTLGCPHYEDFDCYHASDGPRGGDCHKIKCPKREKLCCVHCEDHFACFTHFRSGCIAADESKMMVWGSKGEAMWVNKNPKNHCPVHGHGGRGWR